MTPLKSSNIASVDYDEANEMLTVYFKNGSTYQYAKVPRVVFRELTTAPSAGKYFHSNIRSEYPALKFEKGVDDAGS